MAEITGRNGDRYVDKTLMIRDLCASDGETYIISRPRIFGTSLNLRMVRSFFDPGEYRPELFEGSRIASDKGCMAEAGRHPVIYLDLASAHGLTFEDTLESVGSAMDQALWRHHGLKESLAVPGKDRKALKRICSREAGEEELEDSLRTLIRALAARHGERVVVLVDEYFAPLLGGAEHGYLPESSAFLSEFLSRGLNDNPDLWFAVLTDVTGVRSGEVDAAIGNLRVCSVLDEPFSEYFGFTEEETEKFLADRGLAEKADEVRAWYGGYRFGGREMYNPRSVEWYAFHGCKPEPFWTNVSRNWAIRRFLARPTKETEERLERLSRGETLSLKVNRDMRYESLSEEDVFTLLLYSGYLTSLGADPDDGTGERHLLKIPNEEVAAVFESETLGRIRRRWTEPILDMWFSIEKGDARGAEEYLMDFFERLFADSGHLHYDERGFRLLFFTEVYCRLIRTHKPLPREEHGSHYPDLVMEPAVPDYYGRESTIVFEFRYMSEKRYTYEGLHALAERARETIDAERFGEELKKKGHKKIVKVGIAYSGWNAAVSV